jgi:hypothetical protein
MLKTLFTILRIAVVSAMFVGQPALAAKYYCGGRELSAEETAQAERIMESMRKALPAVASGWIVSSEGGGVDCGEASQPVPANISFRRSYLYMGEAASGSAQEDQAKVAEAEQKLAGLKKQQEELTAKLNAARATRDPKVMQPIQQQMRELQQAQAAQSRELAKLRNEAQRKAGERKNAEWAASQEQKNKADISMTANQAWFKSLFPSGKQIAVPGATLAVRDDRGNGLLTTQLYFGGKKPEGAEGKVAIDPAAGMLKVQNLAIRIEAHAQPTEQLLKGIDSAALKALIQP